VFQDNLLLVHAVEEIAKRKGKTTAQVAIGWVLKQGVIALPGANTVERVKENSEVVELSDEEMKEIDGILKKIEVKGDRYPPALLGLLK
jgi:pyridoxine 4-dehydrogenase